MALTQSSGVAVRAGLVFQAVGLNEHLKIALRDAGVNVVVEIVANALSLEKIREANLDVFVVNLDPELEDSLEELTDMLDTMRRPVIFNDGAASSGLAGWDQARWARHLAAKITGELDATPPRPLDAKSIPAPVRAPAVQAAVVAPATIPVISTPVPVVVINEVLNNSPVQVAPAETTVLDDVFAELDFDFDSESASPAKAAKLDDEESGLEGFDASAFDMPQSSAPSFAGEELSDLDALFRDSAQANANEKGDIKSVPVAPVKSTASDATIARPNVRPAAPEVAVAKPKSDVSALNWSLEPLEGEVLAPVPTGRAVYVAKELPPSPAVVKQEAKPAAPAVFSAPAQSDTSELGDFDFFLDSDGELEPPKAPASAPLTEPTPSAAAITKRMPAITTPTDNSSVPARPTPSNSLGNEMSEFDALFADLNDLSSVSMPATGGAEAPRPTESDTGFDSSSLDFDLDFEVGAPASSNAPEKEDDFADLDALFADSPAQVAPKAEKGISPVKSSAPSAQTGPARVFVLGASIGGPEAVRSFLSKLKPKLPAAFVLAQHMGAEFLSS